MFRISSRVAFIFIVLGAFLLISKSELSEWAYRRYDNAAEAYFTSFISAAGGIFLLATGFSKFIFDYLQGRFAKPKLEDLQLAARVKELEQRAGTNTAPTQIDDFIQEFVDKKVETITTDSLLHTIEKKYGKSVNEKAKQDIILKEVFHAKLRLDDAIRRISFNSNLNLSLGFITTVIAIFVLSYSILLGNDSSPDLPSDPIQRLALVKTQLFEFLIKFIPKLSLSIFIELFSFFFLRMYKRNLDDIKYLNNERTNIEMKVVALVSALNTDDSVSLGLILSELAKTERNFILKKDESTVELEKIKTDSSAYKDTLENLAKILRRE